MNPKKVVRKATEKLTDLPNVGVAIAQDLELIGIHTPLDMVGRDPLELYEMLCKKNGCRHDPCVLDIFMSITDFMNGNMPRPWWEYTEKRKRLYGHM